MTESVSRISGDGGQSQNNLVKFFENVDENDSDYSSSSSDSSSWSFLEESSSESEHLVGKEKLAEEREDKETMSFVKQQAEKWKRQRFQKLMKDMKTYIEDNGLGEVKGGKGGKGWRSLEPSARQPK